MENETQARVETEDAFEGASSPPSFFKKNSWGLILIFILLVTTFLLYLIFKPSENNEVLILDDEVQGDVIAEEGDDYSFSLTPYAFASSHEEISKISPAIPYSKIKLDELSNLSSFSDLNLSESQKLALKTDGFFLAENSIIGDQSSYHSSNDFIDSYQVLSGSESLYYRKPSDAVFISSDLALHLYHILIARTFEKIEEDKFQPLLKDMSHALFLDAIANYNKVSNPKLKEAYQILASYYLVPLVVLDSPSKEMLPELEPSDFENFALYLEAKEERDKAMAKSSLDFSLETPSYAGVELSDEIYKTVQAELSLIAKAKELAASPLFSPYRPELINDYSQFVPRSYYTKNNTLKSYFIAMMWYGRMGFTLKSDVLTRSALITTGQINTLKMENGRKISSAWSDMMSAIDFFVGESDDLSAVDYTSLIKKVYGDKVVASDFVSLEKLEEFKSLAQRELSSPKIISEALDVYDDGGKRDELLAFTKQFRFMGQRFTPDAYIINNLSQGAGAPDPETGQLLPSMPTALMTLSVIAPENEIVGYYLDEWINDKERIKAQDRESDRIIAKVIKRLRAEFKAYTAFNWQSNIYMRWFDSFRSLLATYGQGYPAFMQSEAWAKKNLATVLGSYTELKHDTLLYAKQSYAELGAGGENPSEIPAVPMGYVEPDLVFWNKIIALAKTTVAGLKARDIMPLEFEDRYQIFIDSAQFFKSLSEQELLNQKISEADFEKLRTISYRLGAITAPLPGRELSDKEKRAGIIADIHTDALKGAILYEATGKPHIIYVGVKDVNGLRLTRGLVFNHFEFSEKLDGRLTDEAWQERVYLQQGALPKTSPWTQDLIK